MSKQIKSWSIQKLLISMMLIAISMGIIIYTVLDYTDYDSYKIPIAYTVYDNTLYVLEKDRNTILQLERDIDHGGLKAAATVLHRTG